MQSIHSNFQLIPLAKLQASPTNPRKHFDQARIDELSQSIKSVGLLEPILCVARDDHFEIVAGECRFRAARLAGLEELAAVVREMSPAQIVSAQMAENIARSQLNPIEEADGIQAMMKLGKLTEAEVSKSLGATRKWVQSRLALTGLPERARDAVRIQAMSITVAQEILHVDPSEMDEATDMLLDFGDDLTGAQARMQLQEKYREPRQRREAWRKRWHQSLADKFGEIAEPIEDCENWAKYLRPFGEPYGRWVDGSDRIGAAAAKDADAGIAWRDLAKALGIKGLVVPLRANGEEFLLFDRSKIEAVEKSAREGGAAFTLGPRKRRKDDDATNPDHDPDSQNDPSEKIVSGDDEDESAAKVGSNFIDDIIDQLCGLDPSEIINAIEEILDDDPRSVFLLMSKLGLHQEIAKVVALHEQEADEDADAETHWEGAQP